MKLRASIAIVWTLTAACSKDEPPAPEPKRGVQLAPEPEREPEPEPDPEPVAPSLPSEPDPAAEPEAPAGETVAAEQAAPDEPEKPARNLRSELESMIGSPASCLAPRPANEAPAKVQISLSASVMPSGAVGRGEVSAPGLSEAELGCVKKRLEGLRFSPPIENAPLTVRGSVTLNRGS